MGWSLGAAYPGGFGIDFPMRLQAAGQSVPNVTSHLVDRLTSCWLEASDPHHWASSQFVWVSSQHGRLLPQREGSRWKLQYLLWSNLWRSFLVISAVSYWLHKSALPVMGRDSTRVWVLGGEDHWGHLGSWLTHLSKAKDWWSTFNCLQRLCRICFQY